MIARALGRAVSTVSRKSAPTVVGITARAGRVQQGEGTISTPEGVQAQPRAPRVEGDRNGSSSGGLPMRSPTACASSSRTR